MADLTQNIKYTVEVDASALDRLKTLLDDVAARAKAASDAFGPLATSSAKVSRAIIKATEGMAAQTTSAVQLADGLAGLNAKFEELVKMGKVHADSVKQAADGMKSMDKAADAGAQSTDKLTKSKKKLKDEIEETDKGSSRLMSTWLKLYGVFFSARSVIERTYQTLKEGAQQVDLDRTLGNQIAGFQKLLDGVRESTAGMVSDGKLKKSIALMSSFGIPTQRMGESLELVQKMAIRTGQSADFLTESFARGISRLSPLILDNLGIQVSLKDANEAYALSVGKTTDKLTKAEQITALMNHTLEKMKKNTEGVDLESSVGGSVERAKVQIENMWDAFTARTARGAGRLFAIFGDSGDKAASAVGDMNDQLVKLKASGASAEAIQQYEAVRDNLVGLARLGVDFDMSRVDIFDIANAEGRDYLATLEAIEESLQRVYRAREMGATPAQAQRLDSTGLDAEQKFALVALRLREQAAEAAQQQTAAFDQYVRQLGGALSDEQLAAKLNENKAATTKAIDAQIKAIRATGEDITNDMVLQLINLQRQDFVYGHITAWLKLQAFFFKENADKQAAAMKAMEGRLKLVEQDAEHAERMRKMLDGQFLTQVQLDEAKAKSAALEKEYLDWHETHKKAANDADRAAALTKMEELRGQIKAADDLAKSEAGRHAETLKYIESFKNASKVVLQAEINKLKVMSEQLTVQAALLETALRLVGLNAKVDMTVANQMKQQAADAAARAKALEALEKKGGSGGRAPRERVEREPRRKDEKHFDWIGDMARRVDEARDLFDKIQQSGRGERALGLFDTLIGADWDSKKANESLEAIKEIRVQYDLFKRVYGAGAETAFFDGTGLTPDTLDQIEQSIGRLAEHMMMMSKVSETLSDIGSAFDSMLGGMTGLFGSDIISMMGDFTRGLEGMAAAFEKNAGSYDMLMAGMPVIRAFTNNLIKDAKTRAWIEMAMQAAASWAAFATGNVPKGVAHATAATMYGLVAGGVFKLPKGKAKDETTGGGQGTQMLRRDVHIHIAGPIATTEAERGAMIRDAIRAAEREGI